MESQQNNQHDMRLVSVEQLALFKRALLLARSPSAKEMEEFGELLEWTSNALRPQDAGKDEVDMVAQEMANEYKRALTIFPEKSHSEHEAFAVLLEEVDELKAEVWKNQKKSERLPNIRKESIQVGAMAIRMVIDRNLKPTNAVADSQIKEEKNDHPR